MTAEIIDRVEHLDRRSFLKLSVGAAVGVGGLPGGAATAAAPLPKLGDIRAILLHLGHNMWCDWFPTDADAAAHASCAPDRVLRCRDDLWLKTVNYAAQKGLNMIVVDLGEGVVYPSHPELSIKGSWSAEKLRTEVRRLRALGVEVIPKLNFSTSHNGWLKQYRRMVSTPAYYQVCEDVLRDAYEIFDRPRFIHIGCDEETASHQLTVLKLLHIVARTQEFWKRDFLHLVRTVERLGARPWVWSDYGWDHPEYFSFCPKSVVQSNWYYDERLGGFDLAKDTTSHRKRLKEFWDLEAAGFDQIPCGTNWVGSARRKQRMGADDVIGKLVKLGREVISEKHLLGFLMAPWATSDTEKNTQINLKGIDLFADALDGKIAPPGRFVL